MKLTTRIRQSVHRFKQRMKYRLGISKPGPSPRRLREIRKNQSVQDKGVIRMDAALSARVLRKDGEIEDLGVISRKLVTDAFINLLVDELQASTGDIGDFEHHGSGISATAESGADTALGSEVEVRTNGSQGEGATSNIYMAVGVVPYTAAYAIREHGVFDAAAGGTLMDRSVFGAINVTNGDSIEFSYELTITGS